jgi:hypothetical protein
METTKQFTAEDIAYIKEHFVRLNGRPPQGPAASYVLEDGSEFYPRAYFDLETDEGRFKERLRAEMRAQNLTSLDVDETWQTYLEGIYGICLREAAPENIVRKGALLERIDTLVNAPREDDPQWVRELKAAVDALDALELPFSPHYDRSRFGRPPTRDSHIRDVRLRFPQIV